ncbi:serine protease 30-like [Wyeomyia smithii]|uniref:serine protease 30-like n=1 Tax=Wyeomyia smithii TaxID=174621 RepID=UPI0024681E4E|nr:serine protease 30-like [Wyeomyia smithii]XP_055551566.1 serine protease 30-like [Wyeomyia smithii]
MKFPVVTFFALLATVSCHQNGALECGIPKIVGNEMILNGQETAPGDWPWHAAIYHRKGRSVDYVCGGTVISEQFLLTAAHCLMNVANSYQLAPNRVFVRVGIHSLDVVNPTFVQQHEVAKIHKFVNFTRLVNDIALIELSTLIHFTKYVLPACVNLEPNLNGESGTVIGWGLTEDDETSPTLRKVDIPVIDAVTCLKTDRALFGQTLDDGIFCAGYTNGTGVCNGDSGGGLFFRRANTWFLGGIVSFSQTRPDDTSKCYTKGYGAFSKVHHYLTWIGEITGMSFRRANEVKICKAVEPDSTKEYPNLLPRHCGVYIPNRITGGVKTKVFEFPWMAIPLVNNEVRMCPGTLINKRYVLTVAHCFGNPLPDKVRLGEHTLDQDIDCNLENRDCAPPVRDYNIECITTHPGYSRQTPLDDIALIRLSEDVKCEDHIQPICLPHSADLKHYRPPRYIVTGWGKTETEGEFPKTLLKATVSLTNNSECEKLFTKRRSPLFLNEKQLCAGENNVGPCAGDSGAPLAYGANLNGVRFVQFGLVSLGGPCGFFPTVYTNVAQYMDWIIANMKP